MKRNTIIIPLIIVFLGLFATGCGNSTPDEKQQKKAPNQTVKKDEEQKKKAKRKPLPRIGKLKKSGKITNAAIQFVNGTDVRKAKDPVRITDEFIEIKGAAIDRPMKKTAAGVYLKINDQYFKARYGQKNPTLVRALKNKDYIKSGFSAKIAKSKFEKGDYDVTLLVVSSNRKVYYEVKKKIKIKIR